MAIPYPATPDGVGRPRRTWDLVLSIVLLILSVLLGLVLFLIAPLLFMASDPCGSSTACDSGQIAGGVLFAWFAPPVVLVTGIVVGILLLVRRRIAFWVPLTASLLAVGVFFMGAAIAVGGVEGATL
jgi:hypothetical protein